MIYVYGVIFFLLGTAIASFSQLVGDRIPAKGKLNGRSHCDHCQRPLRTIDVIPILGFLINKGKCHYCGEKINPLYIWIELLGGVLFLASFLLIGLSLELVVAYAAITVFLIEAISDARYQIVIDSVWITGLVVLIAFRLYQGDYLPYIYSSLILFGSLFLISYLGKIAFKKEALGGGDVKLYIFIGFVLTIWKGLLSIFFASLFALIYALVRKRSMNTYIPLVPFIFLGVLAMYFVGDFLIDWYLGLFGV